MIDEPSARRIDALESAFTRSTEQVAALVVALDALVRGIVKDRRVVRVLIVSVALDLLLSAGFIYVAVRTSHNSKVAHNAAVAATAASAANTAAIHQGCVSANEFRSESVALWTQVFTPFATTPEAQANLAQILDTVKKVYAQRDCSQAGGP